MANKIKGRRTIDLWLTQNSKHGQIDRIALSTVITRVMTAVKFLQPLVRKKVEKR